MKVWNSYGSEHSANLVMIGSFQDAGAAEQVKEIIDQITELISSRDESYEDAERYPDDMRTLLEKLRYYPAPSELDQFRYDVRSTVKNGTLVIRTDEDEISAFLKLLIHKGAQVQVYCADQYPDTEAGSDGRE